MYSSGVLRKIVRNPSQQLGLRSQSHRSRRAPVTVQAGLLGRVLSLIKPSTLDVPTLSPAVPGHVRQPSNDLMTSLHLPPWADVLPAEDPTWVSLAALLTIPALGNAATAPVLALALVSEGGKVTPWTFTTPSTWKASRFAGKSKTAARASTMSDPHQLEGVLRVPPDFGPVGGVLVRLPTAGDFPGFKPNGNGAAKDQPAFVDTLTLSPPTSGAAGTTPGVTVPIHSYLFKEQKTRAFLARAGAIGGVDASGRPVPPALVPYRLADLRVTRGEVTSQDDPTQPQQGNYQPSQRIYQYDVYNDLGADHASGDKALRRPNLGGAEFPYPRRIRTGRPLNPDGITESKPVGALTEPYLPQNERFSPIRLVGFAGNGLVNKITATVREKETNRDNGPGFSSVHEVKKWFNRNSSADSMEENEAVRAIIEKALGAAVAGFTFDTPAVMQAEIQGKQVWRPDMWRYDEEFGRQVVAGQNPVTLQAVRSLEGTAFSAATVPPELTGCRPVEELAAAAAANPSRPRLFQIDYNTIFNDLAGSQKWKDADIKGREVYGSRVLLYAGDDGSLRPVAVELQEGVGAPKRVLTPRDGPGVWMLAKMFVAAADSSYHQVVSHFTRSHAAVEPIIVASRRCLSLAHPVGRLLAKHFTYNLQINAQARIALINAGGVIESTFSPARFAMELGSKAYGATWRFDRQAVPADLLARGVAVEDASAPHGVRLVEGLDQPYATDALAVWGLLHGWVSDYINIFYPSDEAVLADKELVGGEVALAGGEVQVVPGWWPEIREKGHPDISHGWPELTGRASLADIVTTVIWLGSGYHASINFGQYDFSGLLLNRSSLISKKFPAADSDEYKLLAAGADTEAVEKLALSFLASPPDFATVLTVIELLSTHEQHEVYLGDTDPWVLDQPALERYQQFGADLQALEQEIQARNADAALVNRCGDFTVPYTLLIPSSTPGVTRRGIPNSISI